MIAVEGIIDYDPLNEEKENLSIGFSYPGFSLFTKDTLFYILPVRTELQNTEYITNYF